MVNAVTAMYDSVQAVVRIADHSEAFNAKVGLCQGSVLIPVLFAIVTEFSFHALMLLVRQQEGHLVCKKLGVGFVGGDSLTSFAPVSPSSLSRVKSRMETFCCRLTQVVLENGH